VKGPRGRAKADRAASIGPRWRPSYIKLLVACDPFFQDPIPLKTPLHAPSTRIANVFGGLFDEITKERVPLKKDPAVIHPIQIKRRKMGQLRRGTELL
jgi:hypothetical protein